MDKEKFTRDQYTISTDHSLLDIDFIHSYLSRSYWAEDIPKEIVKKSIENSLCFGIYKNNTQVGFARVVSDYSTFAYLADVFVIEEERGKGLSKWLMECILKHKELQGLRNFSLLTRDAHTLYEQFGFKNLEKPHNFMAIKKDNFYKKHKLQ
ncbi:MAG: GCN5-related N-acetyltransferase [Bacteroidota bacterium]|jgi:GNAT superfamily N-acetyltransferase|nr:GCN5-related N-acetyltransferase [Bacteroidota bacterium]